jgi:hypothetical protein
MKEKETMEIDAQDAIDMAKAIIRQLEAIHNVGIVHGNVCPDNIMCVGEKEKTLMLVGFGSAESFIVPYAEAPTDRNQRHKWPTSAKWIEGLVKDPNRHLHVMAQQGYFRPEMAIDAKAHTGVYASVRLHEAAVLVKNEETNMMLNVARGDDVCSVLYMLLEWLGGILPWDNRPFTGRPRKDTEKENVEESLKAKKALMTDEMVLAECLPREFHSNRIMAGIQIRYLIDYVVRMRSFRSLDYERIIEMIDELPDLSNAKLIRKPGIFMPEAGVMTRAQRNQRHFIEKEEEEEEEEESTNESEEGRSTSEEGKTEED